MECLKANQNEEIKTRQTNRLSQSNDLPIAVGANQGKDESHASNLQQLIEDVTKKEEKWTKDQVSSYPTISEGALTFRSILIISIFLNLQDLKLISLVDVYKVENIKQVHQRLNEHI